MEIHKDRFGNRIGIRKNNVVIIHDKNWFGSTNLESWGLKKGDIGLVKEFGCVIVKTHEYHLNGCFGPNDLEVIGTL